MTTKRRITRFALAFLAMVCAIALVALVGCSQPQKSEEKSSLAANDTLLEGEVAPFYVLLIGNDSREGTVEANKPDYSDLLGRADTCMLAYVNPQTYHVALITIPRDTAAYYEDNKIKFNYSYYLGGAEGAVQAVEDLAGIKIKYYFDLSFSTFEEFVDEIGGVYANVPVDMGLQDIVSGEYIYLNQGEDQQLNGAEALVLARVRKIYPDGTMEAIRQIQDRAIVRSIIQRVANNPEIAGTCINALYTFAKTDMPKSDLTDLVDQFCANADKLTFASGTGPYIGGIDGETGQWMAYRDEDTWHEIISVVEQGGDPTTVVAIPYGYGD